MTCPRCFCGKDVEYAIALFTPTPALTIDSKNGIIKSIIRIIFQPYPEGIMTDQPKTGSVTSKSGKITVRGKIVTGIDLDGAVDDETLKLALESLQRLNTGKVSGDQGVEAEEIVTGLRYLNPQAPTRQAFAEEVKTLQQDLQTLAAGPAASVEIEAAVETLAGVQAEVQKEKPLPRRIVYRLRETIALLADAGQVLDAASNATPLLIKATATATLLYQAAQTLF